MTPDEEIVLEESAAEKIITKEQLYQILHISKRRAKFLLDNGYIPCVDTGKKTRRYQIKMSDVQNFIDSNVEVDYSTLPSAPVKKVNKNIMYDNLDHKKAKAYYENLLSDKNPVLSTGDICQITGYTNESVRRWIKKGVIKTFFIANSYAIPKEQFMKFLLSRDYNDIEQKSKLHEKTNLQLIK